MSWICGIDPGYTGAIVFIDITNPNLIAVYDMPTMINGKGKSLINIRDLAHIIEVDNKPVAIYLETVATMPGQGISSAFRFGEGYGIIQGIAGTLGVPIHFITPKSWKTKAGLIGTDKDYSRTLAIQQHPALSHLFSRKNTIGRADALHIAKYGLAKFKEAEQ